ncbi:recombinase family protein [uncultured Metabacillus sp.]|uniref:recombinase family protein n=1 Tax=uncultured Metabacillus sp. TaxID=2860135 RepID=UPI002624A522|nr:recombinase family protein [uncultured Metabacillus sp.]
MKKRVITLYRVSTKGQVNNGEDDIPMQRKACRKFIDEQKDWELIKEYSELGVSGWKKGTDDRDALIQIKQLAEKGEFDILLVFLFDRIGRKDDESPLVVDFLHKNGVECWSVKEGKRSMENHIDKLMNYITFWQSSGESLKTSVRVQEIMSQMNEEGLYTGGKPPIGYEVYETTKRHPKKDKFIKDIRINEEEKEIVELIFNLFLEKGYGSGRISQYLNEHGYKNREGKVWRDNTILRMLRNPIYIGRKRYNYKDKNDKNKTNTNEEWKLQPKNEDLVIIDEQDFYKVQQIMDMRKNKTQSKNINIPTKSKLLLTGFAYCGYCGSKLSADYSVKKYKRKTDGEVTITKQYRYVCHHAKSVKHPVKSFASKKYDNDIQDEIIRVFSEEFKLEEFINDYKKYRDKNLTQKKKELSQLKTSMESKHKQLDKLNDELVNVLMGESKFTEDQLSRALKKVEGEIEEIQCRINECEEEIRGVELEANDAKNIIDNYDGWVEEYQKADFDRKKIMLSQVVDKVIIKKNEAHIQFKFIIERNISDLGENLDNIEVYNTSTSDRYRRSRLQY